GTWLRLFSHGRARTAPTLSPPGSGHKGRSQPLRGRVSSNDFDGPHSGARDPGQGAAPSAANYPAPEGWGNDGFWRDSAIDSNYETGMQRAVPTANAPHEDPGYSYFSDGGGWESKPGASEQPGQAPGAGALGAPGVSAPGVPAAGAPAVGATAVGAYGAGGDATSV